MRKIALSAMVVVFLMSGCVDKKKEKLLKKIENTPQPIRTGFPPASGGYVLSVKGETIKSEEIVNIVLEDMRSFARSNTLDEFKRQTRNDLNRVVSGKISNILLYQLAQKEAGDGIEEALEKAVNGEIQRFILEFNGDTAKAEQKLREMGMTWGSFREYQERLILTQSYIQKKVKKDQPVTYSEIVEYYNRVKDKEYSTPAKIKFQLIDIQPTKIQDAQDGQSRGERARDIAQDLIRRINSGEDFGELAKQYAHGPMAIFGGEWPALQPDSLQKPYDILAAEAEKMRVGQIAGPFEKGDYVFIMKLLDKQAGSTEPLEKVQKEIEYKINFERRRHAFTEIETEIIQKAAINNVDKFVEHCLDRIHSLSNQ